jgi:FlaG/FlaF family flagellin (archaellin)
MMKGSPHRNSSSTPLLHADHSSGVSELIGGILMIVLVVAAVAIIGIFLFSQQPPQKVPNINFMTGTDTSGNLYLYHNGGDSLKKGDFAVVIDGQAPRTDFTISDGSTEWSVGRNLKLGVSGTPKSVAIIYNGTGSGEVVLRSASSSVAVLQNSINPSGTPVIPGGGSGGSPGAGYIFNDAANISNSSYFVDAIRENVTANRINFYKNSLSSSGGLKLGSYLSLRVIDTTQTSQMLYKDASTTYQVKLNNTDVVKVAVQSQTKNFKTFGIAPQIWELTAQGADLTITRLPPIPSISATKVDIMHTWISNYQLVDSTLKIDTSGDSVTALTVNNTVYLPLPTQSTDPKDIIITNAKPLPVGLFLIIIDDSQKTAYLVGTADNICWGTNCGPFGL